MAFTICHLETDASLNNKRFKTLEDGSTLKFAGGGVVLRTVAMRPIAHFPVPLGFVRTSEEAECRAVARRHPDREEAGSEGDSWAVRITFIWSTSPAGRYEFPSPDLMALGQEIRAEAATLSGFILAVESVVPPPHPGRWRSGRRLPRPPGGLAGDPKEPT